MLVLKRRVAESFWINDNIEVKVLSVGRTRVTLGVSAPPDTKILREELRSGTERDAAASVPASCAARTQTT